MYNQINSNMIGQGIIYKPIYEVMEASNGKKGIKRFDGDVVVQPLYDSIVEFDMGPELEQPSMFDTFVYRVEQNNKYGLVKVNSIKPIEILPLEYDELIRIKGEDRLFVIAKKDDKYGLFLYHYGWFLPIENDAITNVEYREKNSYNWHRYILIKKDNKYGVLLLPRVHKVSFVFDEILPPIDEFGIRAKKNGVWGHIGKDHKFTSDLSQVRMEWEDLSDIRVEESSQTLHMINRGKKEIKSEIDIPKIDIDF